MIKLLQMLQKCLSQIKMPSSCFLDLADAAMMLK